MKHTLLADTGGFFPQALNWKPFLLIVKQVYYLVTNRYYVQYQDVAIGEQNIAEKNKREGFVRFIAVVQILWFVMNCIDQVAQHLV